MFALVTTTLIVLGTITIYFTVRKNRLFLSVNVLLQMVIQNLRRRKEIYKLLEEEYKSCREPGRRLRASLRCVEAGWSRNGEKLDGIRLTPGAKAENVRALQSRLVLRPDDVVVASYPKSGTTWVMQIVKLMRNNGVESGQDVEEAFVFVDVMSLAEVEALPSPRGFKSHLPFSHKIGGDHGGSAAKFIYVYRNPKDAAVSLYHMFHGMYPMVSWNEFFDILMAHGEDVPFGNPCDHVVGWWKHRSAPNILFVCYEDMIKSLEQQIRRISDFLGLDVSSEVLSQIASQTKFEAMKKNPAANMHWVDKFRDDKTDSFIRKGIIGDWKNHFTKEQSAKMDEMIAKKVDSDCGLKFDFGD